MYWTQTVPVRDVEREGESENNLFMPIWYDRIWEWKAGAAALFAIMFFAYSDKICPKSERDKKQRPERLGQATNQKKRMVFHDDSIYRLYTTLPQIAQPISLFYLSKQEAFIRPKDTRTFWDDVKIIIHGIIIVVWISASPIILLSLHGPVVYQKLRCGEIFYPVQSKLISNLSLSYRCTIFEQNGGITYCWT